MRIRHDAFAIDNKPGSDSGGYISRAPRGFIIWLLRSRLDPDEALGNFDGVKCGQREEQGSGNQKKAGHCLRL
jgi:hypothetical protein